MHDLNCAQNEHSCRRAVKHHLFIHSFISNLGNFIFYFLNVTVSLYFRSDFTICQTLRFLYLLKKYQTKTIKRNKNVFHIKHSKHNRYNGC